MFMIMLHIVYGTRGTIWQLGIEAERIIVY